MRFLGWELDLSGSMNPATLVMDSVRSVRAVVSTLAVPPAPPRVLNAAWDSDIVAPGSLASLFGTDLAGDTASSTAELLPQALAGVTLRSDGWLLPLLFVSPSQINFQIPWELEPGCHRLEIHREGVLVRQVSFRVAQVAPGLFVATHGEGVPITEDAPAQPGERILLYGTGFGKYSPALPDGVSVPEAPVYSITGLVQVTVGGREIAPERAVAASGLTGVSRIEVTIPKDFDARNETAVQVLAGGIASNVLTVPVR
jgi:uncharacterized protein (TIGR03437 family)